MQWPSWARVAGGLDRPEPGGQARLVRQPHRSLVMTAALAAVLCGLGGFTLWGTLQTTQATEAQSRALVLDSLFSEARAAVAIQEMEVRHYQLEPTNVGRARYMEAAAAADEKLGRAVELSSGPLRDDVLRLQAAQDTHRRAADQLILMVTDRDPNAIQQDRLEVTPAYYTLQRDIDRVARDHHSEAERRIADLRTVQGRIFGATAVGFIVGLALVAMIWRVMLGYQRRLVEHAEVSQHQALHDPLTGLANRLLFERQLEVALEAARDGSKLGLAVMLIDLNGFKSVNDTLGHQAGDEVLIETGQRLRKVCREGDTVARFGGDEFAVLLPTVATPEAAREIAERVTHALSRNFLVPDGAAAISGSVGIALCTDGPEGMRAEDMLRRADAAMYRAKNTGKGVIVYDPKIDIDQPDQMALFGDLRALLDQGDPDRELMLYYQPQVRIADAAVVAAEALVRWRHPDRGLLLPETFLGVAETGGLEIPLTYHLLRMAVGEAARWYAEARPLIVSVNVSPNCLLDDAFVDQVRSALADNRLPGSLLRLEVTESGMTTDPARALAALRKVQGDGVQVSIDDYGTGFSSLNQLKRITADELKIDRTFIQDLASDPGDTILVRSAIDLAHALGLFVTAEGVEDLAAAVILRDLRCDQIQGFALGEPVPAEGLLAECMRAEETARNVFLRESGSVPRLGIQ